MGGGERGGAGGGSGGGHSAKREEGAAGGGAAASAAAAARRPLSARPSSARSRPESSSGQPPPPITNCDGDSMDAGVRAFREFCKMDEARPASSSGRPGLQSPGLQPRVRRNPSVCAKITTPPGWRMPLSAAVCEMSVDSLVGQKEEHMQTDGRGSWGGGGGWGDARRPQSAPAARRTQVWEQDKRMGAWEQDGQGDTPVPFARRVFGGGGGGGVGGWGGVGAGLALGGSPMGRGGGGGRRERPWSASVKGTPKNSLIPYVNQRGRPSSARTRPT